MQLSGIGCCCHLHCVDFASSGFKNLCGSRSRGSPALSSSNYGRGFLDSFLFEELKEAQNSGFRLQHRNSAVVRCSVSAGADSRDDIGRVVRALQSRDRFPKKWLGQHYMVDEKVNEKVVNVSGIFPGDLVVEIGPGTGALTKSLVAAGAYVIAVEKDPDMASLMAERFAGSGKVDVVNVDFLKWPVRNVVTKYLQKASLASTEPKHAKVVSNLPFNITTNVVKKILPMGDLFSTVVLLLQDEAALRLVDASPDSGDYRPISFVVNFYSGLFDLLPHIFLTNMFLFLPSPFFLLSSFLFYAPPFRGLSLALLFFSFFAYHSFLTRVPRKFEPKQKPLTDLELDEPEDFLV